jgi:hypothetical protein
LELINAVLGWDYALRIVGMIVVIKGVKANILSQVLGIVCKIMVSTIALVPIDDVEFNETKYNK